MEQKPLFGAPSWALALALGVAVLDQATKAAVRRLLDPFDERVLVPGFLSLRHGENEGLAFGVLSHGPLPYQAVWLTALALTLIGVLVAFWARIANTATSHTALGLILGGALGNVIDRVRSGAVTDFVHVYWRRYSWPDFNMADSAICVAIGLLVLDSFRTRAPASGPSGAPAPLPGPE